MSPVTQDKLVNYLMDRTDKFGNYINELAKQLGVAATHVYGVLVRQQYAEAIGLFVQNGLIILFWIVAIIVMSALLRKAIRYGNENDHDDVIPVYIILGIVGAILGIVFLVSIWDVIDGIKLGIMKMINPEYYALKDIMDFIQSKVKK